MTQFFWRIINKKTNKNRRHPREGGDPILCFLASTDFFSKLKEVNRRT